MTASDWITLVGAIATPAATVLVAWLNRDRGKSKGLDDESARVDDAD